MSGKQRLHTVPYIRSRVKVIGWGGRGGRREHMTSAAGESFLGAPGNCPPLNFQIWCL